MKCRDRHEVNVSASSGKRPRRSGRLGLAAIVAAGACALLAATAAQASTITVGSVLPPGSAPTEFGQVETFFNTALPEKGANLASPVSGAIVRWRVQGAVGGPFSLRVLRPNGSGGYAAAGTSNPASPSGEGVQTFTANLPIHAGDLIGLDPTSAKDKIGIASVAGASYGFIFPPPIDGATVAPSETIAGKEIEFSAEVQPTPVITSVSPNFGSIAGGTSVTITGTDLAAASAVKFGSLPATGFTAESETKITAIAPPSTAVGPVDVSATTLAGTSVAAKGDLFFYRGCVVPKLKGKKLKRSKRALRRSDCKLGRVKGEKKNKSAKVTKQSPKPGKILAPGSKVNIKVEG